MKSQVLLRRKEHGQVLIINRVEAETIEKTRVVISRKVDRHKKKCFLELVQFLFYLYPTFLNHICNLRVLVND